MIVPTKDLVENEANGTASVWRVLKVVKPDDTGFPLQGRSAIGKDEPGLDEGVGNHEPTLEDQDSKPVEGDDRGGMGESFQLSTAHAVHDETIGMAGPCASHKRHPATLTRRLGKRICCAE